MERLWICIFIYQNLANCLPPDLCKVDDHDGGPGHGDALGDGAAHRHQPAGTAPHHLPNMHNQNVVKFTFSLIVKFIQSTYFRFSTHMKAALVSSLAWWLLRLGGVRGWEGK